ncbi:MAG: ZIP family metal transporter [Bacteroidia bacterium]|nr:ZIP family metal transporter [Bacteroidia bacterium]
MGLSTVFVALFVASVGSLLIASSMLLMNDKHLDKLSGYFLYTASGILLGAAFLGMIPKAVEMLEVQKVTAFILIGILVLFTLEKFVLWRKCPDENCERNVDASTAVALVGDAFHHVIDGVVVTSSFLISTEVGITVTLSIIFHEVPKGLGDLSILIRNGLTRKKAFWYKTFTVSMAMIFGLIAYFLSESIKTIIPYVLSFSAASFLYLSLAELIPEMHKKSTLKDSVTQISFILIGVLIIYLSLFLK